MEVPVEGISIGERALLARVVTIDGPAGSGKSTVARRLADRLGWRLLDTGAMYRAVAFAGLRAAIDLDDEAAWKTLVATLSVELPQGRVVLNGEEITAIVRSVEVTRSTRHAADSPSVRARLVDWQRQFAATEVNIVTEGRDQGTIVFPAAFRKYFLTATDEERARRRFQEYVDRGDVVTFASVLRDLQERDIRDATRLIAPMRPAEDARIIDSTDFNLDELVAFLEADIIGELTARSAS